MRKPNFFIIGAPKCGTTSLAEWLNDHPNIYMSPIKEPHYFSLDLRNRQINSERDYIKLFKGVRPNHLAVGEASVWYLYSKVAVYNILKEIPSAKFIVCLRNPIDMAYSLHGQQLVSTNENILDFARAWDLQHLREKNIGVPRLCEDPRLLLYGPACSLGQQMSRLYGVANKDSIMTILLEDMQSNPSKCYQDVLQFLGVTDDGRSHFPAANTASQRRWPNLHNMVKAISYVRSEFKIPRFGTGIMPILNRINRKPSTRATLDQYMRNNLVKYFARDIQQLESLLDRDLRHWTAVK